MNKQEFVGLVSERLEGGRSAAQRAVEAVFEAVQEAVARGEKVAITGFGVFERVERSARTGRNPATGEPVQVEASRVPKFRPGSEFKAYVSGARELVSNAVGQARATAAQGARAAADRIDPGKKAQPTKAAKAAKATKAATKAAAKKATKKAARKAPAKRASS